MKNLTELRDAMIRNDPAVMDLYHPDQWSTDLPTFGGDVPTDTTEVWSWDNASLLVGASARDLEIVPRSNWR